MSYSPTPTPLRPLHHSYAMHPAYHHQQQQQQQQQKQQKMMHQQQQQQQQHQRKSVERGLSPPTSPKLLPVPSAVPNYAYQQQQQQRKFQQSLPSSTRQPRSPSPPAPVAVAPQLSSSATSPSSASSTPSSSIAKLCQSRGWSTTTTPASSINSHTASADSHIRYDGVLQSLKPALPSYHASQQQQNPTFILPLLMPSVAPKTETANAVLPMLPEKVQKKKSFAVTQVTGCDAMEFKLCKEFDEMGKEREKEKV
ncbi:hypothetical protein HDU97_006837 [Phlyctochytrium planicorne]|nr:hypothetical protein HDU97_006837 [Phlyctochytrium planicorne]